jgi:rubrerythrin
MALSQLRKAQMLSGSFTQLMAKNEAVVADIYSAFAELLPRSRDFWLALSREEIGHQHIIELLEEKIQNGELTFKRPGAAHARMVDALRSNCRQKARVEKQGISMREALRIAILIETSMLESEFFEVVVGDSDEASTALKDLESHTRTHRERIETESKKLKWRILGWQRSAPAPQEPDHEEPQFDDSAGIKAQVTIAQAEVLDRAVTLEEASSKLYATYGQRAPAMKVFWDKIAAEEMQHAHLLRTLEGMLEKGTVFYNVGRFHLKDLEDDIGFILNAETKARSEELSVLDTIMTASLVEKMIVECSFYQTIDSDAPEYKIIAQRLIEHTKEHIQRLDQEIQKVMVMGDKARTPLPPISP